MKYITFLLFLTCTNTYSQNIVNGLKGFDATYYYRDSKGYYWLGTGSSGGIFLNNGSGQWKAYNNPFGPAHITWIGEVNSDFFTLADDNYYKFNSVDSVWSVIKDAEHRKYIEKIKNNFEESNYESIKKLAKEKGIIVPMSYNYLSSQSKDTLFICSNYGLFSYSTRSKNISQVQIDIEACDVFQVAAVDKSLFVLTNDFRICRLENSTWGEVFSLRKQLDSNFFYSKFKSESKIVEEPVSVAYRNGYFTVSNNRLLYTLGNRIYIVDLKSSKIKYVTTPKDSKVIEAEYRNDTLRAIDFVSAEMNYLNYKNLYYINGSWQYDSTVVSKKSLPIVNADVNCGQINMLRMYEKSRLDVDYLNNYFNYKNTINNKVLSFCFLDSQLYLGTYGSGLLSLKY
jgi:hypothetical protein